jgi:hypothetical protein
VAPAYTAAKRGATRAASNSGGDHAAFQRDTFYVWLMPPAVAEAEMNSRAM